MTNVADKFGDWIKEGFDIYKNNLGVLILSSLIVCVLTGVSFGILAGPMYAGLIGIVLNLKDGKRPPPTVSDVFQGFQLFLPSFLFCIVWGLSLLVAASILGVVPCIGPLLSTALCLTVGTFLMYGLFLIVDKKMDFWPASMASFEKIKPTFFPFLGLVVVASIIGAAGVIACGIGVIATAPIQFTIIAVSYRDVFGNGAAPPPPNQKLDPPQPPKPPQETQAEDKPRESEE